MNTKISTSHQLMINSEQLVNIHIHRIQTYIDVCLNMTIHETVTSAIIYTCMHLKVSHVLVPFSDAVHGQYVEGLFFHQQNTKDWR